MREGVEGWAEKYNGNLPGASKVVSQWIDKKKNGLFLVTRETTSCVKSLSRVVPYRLIYL